MVDADGDGYLVEVDCDDADAEVNPGADELCNGVDDDCDGSVDVDAVDARWAFTDADGDGFGDPTRGVLVCVLGEDQVQDDTDCDDADPLVHPDADEVCDPADVDEDCDDLVDDADDDVRDASLRTFFRDADGDGYGDPDQILRACDPGPGRVEDDTDCDDGDPGLNPGQVCPGMWDGPWSGILEVDVAVPRIDLEASCTATGALLIAATEEPALRTVGAWRCEGPDDAGGELTMEGAFTAVDAVDVLISLDGEDFVLPAMFSSSSGLTGQHEVRREIDELAFIVRFDLVATPD